MKKNIFYCFCIVITTFLSCDNTENISSEPIPEPHNPKERKIKSIFIKHDNDSISHYTLLEEINYEYGINGFVSKISYWSNTYQQEDLIEQKYYYSGDKIDSLISDIKTTYTAGTLKDKVFNSSFVTHFFHDENGFITSSKKYHTRRLYSENFYYYEGEFLTKSIEKLTGLFGEKETVTEKKYTYKNGNLVDQDKKKYDDYKYYGKNVFSTSLHRISCLVVNNIIEWHYGYSNIERSKYTYNEDLFPITQEKRDGANVLLSNSTYTYY